MQGLAPSLVSAFPVQRLRHWLLLLATALGIYLCCRLALPFLPPLVWAGSLAVLFAPGQGWLERHLRHPGLAALVAVVGIGCLVVIPGVFVGQHLVLQAANGAQAVEARMATGEWRRKLEAQPRLAQILHRVEENIDLPGLAKSITSWLTTTAGTVVRGSFLQAVDFCLTFYLLFFFLRDRAAALTFVRSVSPLPDDATLRLVARVNDTIHAGVYGTLTVAAAQGLLGGLMFWWLGLPAPLLWGVVMAALAVLPVLGAFVVWIPATLYLALEGSWGKAAILTVWGMFVVGTIDNLLRPVLVGNRLKLHTVLAFLSVVGGIILFGPVGILLGPVTLTLTTSLLEVWPRHGPPHPLDSDAAKRRPPPSLTPSAEAVALGRFETDGGPARR